MSMFSNYYTYFIFVVTLAPDEKVFGARYAKNGEFPFIVSIRGKMLCSGSLVTLSKVVTAAHCLAFFEDTYEKEDDLYAVAGSVDLQNLEDGLDVRLIISIILSGMYEPRSRLGGKVGRHDIGLALLDYPFYPGKTVQVMNLISKNTSEFTTSWEQIVAKKTMCYAMGWGMRSSDKGDKVASKSSLLLKVIEVYALPNESCSALFSPSDDMTMFGEICVYSYNNYESVCNGDSGSPLVCNGHSYALLNFAPKCGGSKFPQSYLLYWYYLDFLALTGAHLLISKWLIFFQSTFLFLSN